MGEDHRYAEYRRPFWPWQRWAARRRARRVPVDRSDGRDYVGWAARIVEGPHWPLSAMNMRGRVVAAERQCGELAHRIEFPDMVVTAPLPWPGIELIRP